MNSFFQVFVAALLLSQAFAVPGAALVTPCPEKTAPTTIPTPTPCDNPDIPGKYTKMPKSDSNNADSKYTDSNNADSTYTGSNNADTKTTNYGGPMHPGARTYPEQEPRHDVPTRQFHGPYPNTNGMTTPSPTPSRIPDVVTGSAISLENTAASAIGSNTLSMGAEAGSSALSGNTENGDNAIFGAVQPGGAFGFLGSLGGMFGATPSPMM